MHSGKKGMGNDEEASKLDHRSLIDERIDGLAAGSAADQELRSHE